MKYDKAIIFACSLACTLGAMEIPCDNSSQEIALILPPSYTPGKQPSALYVSMPNTVYGALEALVSISSYIQKDNFQKALQIL